MDKVKFKNLTWVILNKYDEPVPTVVNFLLSIFYIYFLDNLNGRERKFSAIVFVLFPERAIFAFTAVAKVHKTGDRFVICPLALRCLQNVLYNGQNSFVKQARKRFLACNLSFHRREMTAERAFYIAKNSIGFPDGVCFSICFNECL